MNHLPWLLFGRWVEGVEVWEGPPTKGNLREILCPSLCTRPPLPDDPRFLGYFQHTSLYPLRENNGPLISDERLYAWLDPMNTTIHMREPALTSAELNKVTRSAQRESRLSPRSLDPRFSASKGALSASAAAALPWLPSSRSTTSSRLTGRVTLLLPQVRTVIPYVFRYKHPLDCGGRKWWAPLSFLKALYPEQPQPNRLRSLKLPSPFPPAPGSCRCRTPSTRPAKSGCSHLRSASSTLWWSLPPTPPTRRLSMSTA